MYPHERSLVKQHANAPFALLGINSDADRSELKKTLESENITWRSWWDEGRIDGPIHKQWQVTQRPAVFVIDPGGVIRYKDVIGEELDAAVEELLEKHLAKSTE